MTRVAIVTGGTRGIGEAISLALRDMGITVADNYAGNSEREEAFTRSTGIRNYKWEVGDFYACEDFCAQIAEDMGPVDIVINHKGITRNGIIHNIRSDDWKDRKIIRLNSSTQGQYRM